jgi:hypothetical protein
MNEQTTKEQRCRGEKPHRNCGIHWELQHYTQLQHYSRSTVGTVASAPAGVRPMVAYTCEASLYTISFPSLDRCYAELTKGSCRNGGSSDIRPSRCRGGVGVGQGARKLHRWPSLTPVGLHGQGSKGAASNLPATAVLAGLGRVLCGGCCTCGMCCPHAAHGGGSCWGQDGLQNICDLQAFIWQHHQHVAKDALPMPA